MARKATKPSHKTTRSSPGFRTCSLERGAETPAAVRPLVKGPRKGRRLKRLPGQQQSIGRGNGLPISWSSLAATDIWRPRATVTSAFTVTMNCPRTAVLPSRWRKSRPPLRFAGLRADLETQGPR